MSDLAKFAKERRRWCNALLYLGDYRLRLLTARWQWHGLNDRRWHVSFERGPVVESAIHSRFTAAVVIAIFNTYRSTFRK